MLPYSILRIRITLVCYISWIGGRKPFSWAPYPEVKWAVLMNMEICPTHDKLVMQIISLFSAPNAELQTTGTSTRTIRRHLLHR